MYNVCQHMWVSPSAVQQMMVAAVLARLGHCTLQVFQPFTLPWNFGWFSRNCSDFQTIYTVIWLPPAAIKRRKRIFDSWTPKLERCLIKLAAPWFSINDSHASLEAFLLWARVGDLLPFSYSAETAYQERIGFFQTRESTTLMTFSRGFFGGNTSALHIDAI